MLRHHAANVVQPIIRHQRDLTSVSGLHGQTIHLGIGRPSRPRQSRAQKAAWIHHRAIFAAEGVVIRDAFLEQPATIENMLWQLARAPRNAGRFQIVERTFHAIHHT